MQLMTLKNPAGRPQGRSGACPRQLETVASKFTCEQKPYCELTPLMAGSHDTPGLERQSNYKACDSLQAVLPRSRASFTSISNTADARH
jgi:hypothetical protein